MEITLSKNNFGDLNIIRDAMIKGFDQNIKIIKFLLPDQDQILYKLSHKDGINEDKREQIKEIMDSLSNNDRFLFKGSYFPIYQLKILHNSYKHIKSHSDVYYYEKGHIDDKLIKFAKNFLSNFEDENYDKLIVDSKLADILNIETCGIVDCKINENKNSIELVMDQGIHLSDYLQLSTMLYEKMKGSSNEQHYKLSKLDERNLYRLSEGKSPLYDHEVDTFISTVVFYKLSKKLNLPTLNCKDILSFTKNLNIEYYNTKFLELFLKHYNEIDIQYFKSSFNTILEARCFGVYLGSIGIKFLVLEKCVYYQSDTVIKPESLDLSREILIKEFSRIMGANLIIFDDISTERLLNIYNHNGHLVSYRHDINHLNPESGELFPLDYYERKGCLFTGIYPDYNLESLLSNDDTFSRSSLSLPDYEFKVSENSVYCRDKLLVNNFAINDKRKLLLILQKLWKKGYFLNSVGLMYYTMYGDILDECIYTPEWFTLKNSNEENLFKFMLSI